MYRITSFVPVLGVLCALLFAGGVPVAAAPQKRCFPETNYCISGAMLAYWERNGGLPVFGYPISDLRTEAVEGTWVGPTQWFERDRLEDHGPDGVQAGRLGARFLELQGHPWQRGEPQPSAKPCRWFEQTGHQICGWMLSYWQDHGGLARLGYPLTDTVQEPIEGTMYDVQYFERRRVEYHPENAGTQDVVQMGLLGRALLPVSQPGSLAIGTVTIDPERVADPAGDPAARAVYTAETVTLSVTGVQNADRVIFFVDRPGILGHDIGATTSIKDGRASITWTVQEQVAKNYTLYAQASDSNGRFATSPVILLTVLPAGQVPLTK